MNRVIVAMSGGVDSSVAAALLKNKGYEVIGITMCFGLKEAGKKKPSCCGLEGIEDARKVAFKLGIRHYVLNFDKVLQEKVIKNFIEEYAQGRTPNPCVRCNQFLKFTQLLEKAKSLGAAYLATGHYAKILKCRGVYCLKKANDDKKDQSYFLYRLMQKQLAHILMPLGNLTKEQVRKIASEFGLPVAQKPGSQEICFVPDADYRAFLLRASPRIAARIKPGPILDAQGNILGRHKGISFYTIGQREGLCIAKGYPIYITKIDAKTNSIIVGNRQEALSWGLIAKDLSWTGKPIKTEVVLGVKIRYNHKEISSRLAVLGGGKIKIIFSQPQFAVAPGQSVVFYSKDVVVGGGTIERQLAHAETSRKNSKT